MLRLKDKFAGNLSYAVVANEKHQDGTPHVHAVVGLETACRTRDERFFDDILDAHPNLQRVRSPLGAVKYVKKGGDWIEEGDVPIPAKDRKRKRGDEICEMIEQGKSMREIYQSDKGYFMKNRNDIAAMHTQLRVWDEASKKLPLDEISFKSRHDPVLLHQDRVIMNWLVKNLLVKRPFKAPQLFISGPPDVGKTHLVNYLSQFFRIYHVPTGEDFYDLYEDEEYDLCVIDEFKAQKTIQWLNMFLQGSPCPLRKKGSQYLKVKNLPVIILSNYSLEDCYKNQDSTRLESLKARLTEVFVYERIAIYAVAEPVGTGTVLVDASSSSAASQSSDPPTTPTAPWNGEETLATPRRDLDLRTLVEVAFDNGVVMEF